MTMTPFISAIDETVTLSTSDGDADGHYLMDLCTAPEGAADMQFDKPLFESGEVKVFVVQTALRKGMMEPVLGGPEVSTATAEDREEEQTEQDDTHVIA